MWIQSYWRTGSQQKRWKQQWCCITFCKEGILERVAQRLSQMIIHIIHYFYWGSLLTRKVDRIYKYTVPYGVLQSVYTCCTGWGTDLWRLDTCSVTHRWITLTGVNKGLKSFLQNTRLNSVFRVYTFAWQFLWILREIEIEYEEHFNEGTIAII